MNCSVTQLSKQPSGSATYSPVHCTDEETEVSRSVVISESSLANKS